MVLKIIKINTCLNIDGIQAMNFYKDNKIADNKVLFFIEQIYFGWGGLN